MDKNKVLFKSKKSQNFASTFSRILMTDAQFSVKCLAEMCLGVHIRALMGRIVRKKKRITSNMKHNNEEQ
jgi:hypothetical protein